MWQAAQATQISMTLWLHGPQTATWPQVAAQTLRMYGDTPPFMVLVVMVLGTKSRAPNNFSIVLMVCLFVETESHYVTLAV